MTTGERDSHGNVQLSGSGALGDFLAEAIKQRLSGKLRVRADTFGYLQRSFMGVVSPVDAAEAREVGRSAVRIATSGEHRSGSIVIQRRGEGARYEVSYEVTELENVAQKTRKLDPEFLRGDSDVDERFLTYVRPLVGELPRPVRLSDRPVAKKLR
jgi:6-phosphofructokinase 1